MSSSSYQACAVSQGQVYCWQIDQTLPATQVTGLSGVQSVSVSDGGNCAVTSQGSVYCWGYYQSSTLVTTPTLVQGLTNITQVSLGGDVADGCALTLQGTVYCWGDYNDSNTGYSSGAPPTPASVAGLSGIVGIGSNISWTLTGNGFASCGWNAQGMVQCWGGNYGATPQTINGVSGVTALAGNTNWEMDPDFPQLICAVASGGTVQCWNSPSSAFSIPGIIGATAISGHDNFCVLLTGGSVECWGQNSDGQLGDALSDAFLGPETIVGLTNPVQISQDGFHSCALTAQGNVTCWGDNTYGELGNGSTSSSTRPVPVTGLSSVTAVTSAGTHSCALESNGTVYCWGLNNNGELGSLLSGSTSSANGIPYSSTPLLVPGLSGVISIVTENEYESGVGGNFNCALTNQGNVYCWGYNAYGALGNNSTTDSAQPVQVSGLSAIKAITAGSNFACAVNQSGTVSCWGDLEPTPGIGSLVPAAIPGLTGVTSIAANGSMVCALTNSNSVYCWSQFGMTPQPSLVAGLTNVSIASIATGGNSVCALATNGALYCAGSNSFNALYEGFASYGAVTNQFALSPFSKPVTSINMNAYATAFYFNDGTYGVSGLTTMYVTAPQGPVATY